MERFYEERSAGGKRTRARTLQKAAVESAKEGGKRQLKFPKGQLEEF
jgi:hypothetical protein